MCGPLILVSVHCQPENKLMCPIHPKVQNIPSSLYKYFHNLLPNKLTVIIEPLNGPKKLTYGWKDRRKLPDKNLLCPTFLEGSPNLSC